MSNGKERVHYEEPVSIEVGNFLLTKGFKLASTTGMMLKAPKEMRALGILHEEFTAKWKNFLLHTLLGKRREFIGTLYLQGDHWFFEAYGRKHVDMTKRLAEDMTLAFNRGITVHLKSENSRYEACVFDYY